MSDDDIFYDEQEVESESDDEVMTLDAPSTSRGKPGVKTFERGSGWSHISSCAHILCAGTSTHRKQVATVMNRCDRNAKKKKCDHKFTYKLSPVLSKLLNNIKTATRSDVVSRIWGKIIDRKLEVSFI